MKSIMIIELMVNDHIKILKYLNDVEKKLNEDPIAALPAFRTLEWNLEKHIFVEERVIYTNYFHENTTQYSVFFDLKKQHSILLNRMKILKKQIRFEKQMNFPGFKKFLMKHKTFEENNIYPVIDKEIDTKEKYFMIQQIKEIL